MEKLKAIISNFLSLIGILLFTVSVIIMIPTTILRLVSSIIVITAGIFLGELSINQIGLKNKFERICFMFHNSMKGDSLYDYFNEIF